MFKRVLEKAGLRHIRIHDLRHTYTTLLLQAGAPITYLSAQLGHRNASITLRVYAHYLPSAAQQEVDRLDTTEPSATPAQPEAASADQRERPQLFRLSGEPHFHQLEPHQRLAGSTRRPASCCVAASDRLTVALAARRLASVVSGHDIVGEPQGSKRGSGLRGD